MFSGTKSGSVPASVGVNTCRTTANQLLISVVDVSIDNVQRESEAVCSVSSLT